MPEKLIITESVREVWQSSKNIIPTELKINYLNSILSTGFEIVDVGSFVSEKVVPQMADTAEVIKGIDMKNSTSAIMVLVVNERGATLSTTFDQILWISFPFSVSPTFLKLNINSTLEKAFYTALKTYEIICKKDKKFICYLTMGFGNPYHDKWHPEIVMEWIEKFLKEGITKFCISDITGEADAERIKSVYTMIFQEYPQIKAGIHLHTTKKDALTKIEAAYASGVRHFDTVATGLGGCPMTGYELLSNLDTFDLLDFACKKNILFSADIEKLKTAVRDYPFN